MGFIDSFQRMSVDELRQEVINLLKQAYTDGRIIVETLERRLNEAASAEDKESLMALISDIPAPENKSQKRNTSSGTSPDNPDNTWSINNQRVRETQSFYAVIGNTHRTGRWQPAGNLSCFSLLGSIKLDFSEAEFPSEGISITSGCILGSLEIIIPPGINISLSGLPIIGSFENKAESGDAEAPTITVRGFALLGNVEIKQKKTKKKPWKKSRRQRKTKNRSDQF